MFIVFTEATYLMTDEPPYRALLKINVQNHLEITYTHKNNVQNTFKHLLSNFVRYYYNNNVQSQ